MHANKCPTTELYSQSTCVRFIFLLFVFENINMCVTFHVFFSYIKMQTFGCYFVLSVCLLVYFETQSCAIVY